MAEAKHTKGYWTVGERTNGHIAVFEDVPGGMLIADCDDFRDPKVRKANARLIAAAPDLLEVLEAIVASVPAPTEIGIGIGGLEFRMPSWLTDARAAIAKAKGE